MGAALDQAGSRVILEPLGVEHAVEMVQVLAAPELYRFTGGHPPTVAELRDRYARWGYEPSGWSNWVIRRRADGVAVGWIQATVTGSGAGRTAELAWTIAADQQRRGYARDATRAAMAALTAQGVTRFTAHVHPDHAASVAVARGLGLAPTDHRDDGEVLWRTPD